LQALGGTLARVHGISLEGSTDIGDALVEYKAQRPDGSLSLD
jgi:hypothetical protein